LAWTLPCTYLTVYYKEILVSPKIRALFSGTLSQNLDLENFASACQLSKRGRSERDKLDSRRSTKLTIPPSSDSRQATPLDSQGTLVFDAKNLREIRPGYPCVGAKCRWGGLKSATFDK